MKPVTRLLSLLLTLSITLSLVTFPVSAASTPYETVKADVPIWSESNSSSTKVRTEKKKGTVLTVVSSSTNSHGNLWYKLSDGNWVFSGNVKKHTHAAAACSMAKTSYEKKSATEHYFVSKYDDLCSCGAVVKKDVTSKTAQKHTLSGGKCTKCGYTCQHDYVGGICKTCQYEWPYKVTKITKTTLTVSNSDGAKIWSRPYSKSSDHLRTESKGAKLTIVAKTTNEAGNLWYKLSDGSWVFSGNVASHQHKADKLVELSVYEPYNATQHYHTYGHDSFCSCGEKVKTDVKTTAKDHTFHSGFCTQCGYVCQHDYSGGICKLCKAEWDYEVTKITKTTYAVSNPEGAKLWDRPYSNNSVHVGTAPSNTCIIVVAKTTNEAGNLWYKTDTGYWVYSGNLDTHAHKADFREETGTSYKKNDHATHYVITTYNELCACGAIYEKGLTKKVTEDHSFSGQKCTKCDYKKIAETTYTITYNANGGTGAPGAQGHAANSTSTLSKMTPTRTGYTFLGWATSKTAAKADYTAGGKYAKNADLTLYAVWKGCSHKYTSAGGDACTRCGEIFAYELIKVNKTMYAIKDDVPVRNAPYSGSGYVVKTLKQNEGIAIAYSLENALGNPWYRTKDGNYVFADNLSEQIKHVHKTDKTVKGSKSYSFLNINYHIVTETTAASVCSCGEVLKGGEVTSYNERHKTSRGGACTLCNGSAIGEIVTISPTLYTIKLANTPVYKDLHTSSSPSHKLKEGTLVTIVATTEGVGGSADRMRYTAWGKTINGTWIPMMDEFGGRLMEKSSISLPPTGVYEVTVSSAPLRNVASSSAATKDTLKKGQRVQISQTYYNDAGNQWGTTADGYVVYLGNLKYTGSEAQVLLNGKPLELSAPLLNENGNLLIPIRDVAEAMGAQVVWKQSTQTIVLHRGLESVVMQIGNKKIGSGGGVSQLNVAAKLVKGRTYVPLRAVSELFGAEVSWIAGTKTAVIDYAVPTATEITDAFKKQLFFGFDYYSTFAKDHNDLGSSLLYVFSNISKFGTKIVVGGAENIYESFAHGTPLEFNPLDDYSKDEFKRSVEAVLSAIPELEPSVAASALSNYDNVKTIVDYVEEGGSFADDTFKFKSKALESFCKSLEKAGLIADCLKIGADFLEHILQEYTHHLFYLDVLERACKGESKYVAEAIEELRYSYEHKVLNALKEVKDGLMELAADELLGKVPMYKAATLLVEGAFTLVGAKKYSQNVLDAASTYIVTCNMMNYYNALASDCCNWATGNPNTSLKQAQWDEMVAAFTLTKAAVLRTYEGMRGAVKDSTVKAYLDAQMDLLRSIHIQPKISNAKSAPYSVE